LAAATTAYWNVALGIQALAATTTGHDNVAIAGRHALLSNISGNDNVALGSKALEFLTTGSSNVGIGGNSGGNNATGNSNVALGVSAGPSVDALENTIAVGVGATVAASNRAVIGNSSIVDVFFGSETAASNTRQKRVFIVGTTAPADGDLAANQCALWFDPTNGAAKLMIKSKQADGSVKTGSLDVTT